MAIQITGLRPHPVRPKDLEDYSIFDKYHVEASSVGEILKDPQSFLSRIPASEHWNLYFTVAQCSQKKREFESQHVLPFDLDGIDNDQHEAYIEVFCRTLGVKREETGIVASGNGLHFYIGLQVPIVDKKYFQQNKHHYKALLTLVDRAIKEKDLPIGKVDPAIFDHRRILRMPGTINKKPGRQDKQCKVIQPEIKDILFDITVASGIPTVKMDEAIPKEFLRRYPKTDNAAIFEGCNFMQFCRDNPGEVSEPQWYAMLSVTARMENGSELSHNISKNHPTYDRERTEAKIEHALSASPPRKCSSINAIWGHCRGCPNFEKVDSPIMLRSADKLQTEDTGFHTVIPLEGGRIKTIPNYKDLREHFERTNPYVTHSKICWVYNGSYYEAMGMPLLENFAQQKFDPYAHGGMTREFSSLVMRTNPIDPQAWQESTHRRINLRNGVLDLGSMDFLPHDKEYGFKYALPYEYDPDAKAPVFEKFMRDIMCSDEDMVKILEEFGGYALSGDDCKGAKALFLVGEGSNGKSTFIKLLKALAGRNNYQTISLKDFSNMERRHGLDGALFNIAEETPDKVADSTDFKNLVDGGELKVRRLFGDDYTIENRAKLIFSCNTLPASYDYTKGYRRRLLIIPFNAEFSADKGTDDKDIDVKMYAELPGILNILLRGYQRFLKQGKKFTKSISADSALTTYEEENDPIRFWFSLRVEVLPAEENAPALTTAQMYLNYKAYWEEYGPREMKLLGMPGFSRRLKFIVPGAESRYFKQEIERGYRGTRFKGDGKSY